MAWLHVSLFIILANRGQYDHPWFMFNLFVVERSRKFRKTHSGLEREWVESVTIESHHKWLMSLLRLQPSRAAGWDKGGGGEGGLFHLSNINIQLKIVPISLKSPKTTQWSAVGGQPFLSIAATKFNGCYQPEPLLTGGSINKLTINLEST